MTKMTKSLGIKDWLLRYKQLFLNPGLFFHDIRKEKEIGPVVIFVAVLSLIAAALNFVFALPSLIGQGASGVMQIVFSSIMIILEPIFTLLAIFLIAGVLYYLFRWIVSSKVDFAPLFKVVGYSRTIAVRYAIVSALLFFVFELATPGNLYASFASGAGILESTPTIVLFVLGGILSVASFIHVLYAMTSGVVLYENISFGKSIGMILLATIVVIVAILLLSGLVTGMIFAVLGTALA